MSQARSERLVARAAPRRATAEAVAVPALRLVDHSSLPRRRALTRAATVLASALAAVGLFGVVCLHVLLTQGQAELDGLHARADAASTAKGKLTVEVAQLEAPARVVERARLRLGMVPLTAVAYLQAADPTTPLPPVPEGPLAPPGGGEDAGAAATATADTPGVTADDAGATSGPGAPSPPSTGPTRQP